MGTPQFADGAGRRPQRAQPNQMAHDLVSDTALKSMDEDRLDHAAIVSVAADMIVAATPPVNIALFGSWGSGKSSFLAALGELLAQRSKAIRVARYDAWKYGGRALKLNFIESLAEELKVTADDFGPGLSIDQEATRVRMWTYIWRNKGALSLGLLLAVVVTAVWFFAVAGATWVTDLDAGFGKAAGLAITGVGSVLGLALIAVLVGPKVMESAVVKVTTPAPQTDDQFLPVQETRREGHERREEVGRSCRRARSLRSRRRRCDARRPEDIPRGPGVRVYRGCRSRGP